VDLVRVTQDHVLAKDHVAAARSQQHQVSALRITNPNAPGHDCANVTISS
jgi:hypothetical protein